MLPIILGVVFATWLFILAQTVILRWVFKVNKVVRLLESIDESLKQMPAVASYDRNGQRQHAA